MTSKLERIEVFLGQKRFAMVGVSREEKDFSRRLFRDLLARGYDVVPVNPGSDEIDGKHCYPRVQDIPERVGGAMLLTPPAVSDSVVRDCLEAGVSRIWMHRGAGVGAVSEDALALCREYDLPVIDGACPYMFLEKAGWFHRLHGFFARRSLRH